MKKVIVVSILLLGLLYSCTKPRCYAEYSFSIPTYIEKRDTFTIGDTIWFDSTIPNSLVDENSNTAIDVSDFDFKIFGGIIGFDTIGLTDPTLDFDYISEEGVMELVKGGSYHALKYSYSEGRKLKIGFICKNTGSYEYRTYILNEDYISKKITNDNNCIQSADVKFSMNNNTDTNNYEIIKNYYASLGYEYSLDDFQYGGGYAFIVK